MTTEFVLPRVMGILNVTPDSFSDGGKHQTLEAAIKQTHDMIQQGVDIVDIGGESTRPGAKEVGEQEELDRVLPVLQAIKSRFEVTVSIDTSKAVVMRESLSSGADIINDVRALQNDGCMDAVASSDKPVCLMHMQGLPRTMQKNPHYGDIIEDIKIFFNERIACCEAAGINHSRIILDPGFGFGKTLVQNYQLLARFAELTSFGLPLLSGTSRKSMIGNLLNRPPEERLAGSLATAIIAAQNGANIIRVHDVQETVDAFKVMHATLQNK